MAGNQSQTAPRPWVKEYLFPLGSFLIGVLGLLAQTTLPAWMVIIAALYLVTVAAVFLFGPLGRLFSLVMNIRRRRRLARMNRGELIGAVKKFQELIARDNSNTLLYAFSLVAQWDQQRGAQLVPDPQYVETIRNWLSAIERRMENPKPRDFLFLCGELSMLTQQYNHFLCQRLTTLQGSIHKGDWTPDRIRQIKQHWNVNRDAHMTFVKGWENIAKKINEQIGSRLCLDYYQPLGTLE